MKKRFLSLSVAIIMVLALVIPTMAADSSWPWYYDEDMNPVTNAQAAADPTLVKYCYSNVGFHDDGRVRPDGWNKDLGLYLERIDEDTWALVPGQNNDGEFICPKCGGTEWVSYSNKSGLFNGKNIQLVHIGEPPPPELQGNVAIYAGATLTTTTKTITETWQKEITPWETWKDSFSPAQSSVTATTAGQLSKVIYAKNGQP